MCVEPKDPLMVLDCEGSNVLMVSIDEAMMNKTETVLMVHDTASCSIMIKNMTNEQIDIWFVNYIIYHGNQNSIETDLIVIVTGSSQKGELTKFQRIRYYF